MGTLRMCYEYFFWIFTKSLLLSMHISTVSILQNLFLDKLFFLNFYQFRPYQCQLKVCQAYIFYPWTFGKAISSQNNSSLLASTCASMATDQQSQSTAFLRPGQHLNLFVTWQDSLASPSSIRNSSITLSYASCLCMNLPSTSTPIQSHCYGWRLLRRHLVTWS